MQCPVKLCIITRVNKILRFQTYAVSNLLLQNIPPNRVKNDQVNESTGSILRLNKNREHNSREEREGDKERSRSSLQTKFIKNPEQRLYYYADRK